MTDTAHARPTDPDTSHRAAASVTKVTVKQDAVLLVFIRMIGLQDRNGVVRYPDGLTHPELIAMYALGNAADPVKFPPQSDQSIRSRCAELVAQGWVKDTGIRKPTESGRTQAVWAPVTMDDGCLECGGKDDFHTAACSANA